MQRRWCGRSRGSGEPRARADFGEARNMMLPADPRRGWLRYTRPYLKRGNGVIKSQPASRHSTEIQRLATDDFLGIPVLMQDGDRLASGVYAFDNCGVVSR